MAAPTRRWLIDGNNVMGSRADGWWNDRPRAMARLAQQVATWAVGHDDEIVLVFDGAEQPEVALLAGGNLAIRFAPRRGRDAADDLVVTLAADRAQGAPPDVVVTADRGLVARLPEGCAVLGPRRFLDGLGSGPDPGPARGPGRSRRRG